MKFLFNPFTGKFDYVVSTEADIPDIATTYLKLDASNDPVTGALLIDNTLTVDGVADAVQLTVQANAAQTVNIAEWQNSAGVALVVIDPSGDVGVGTGNPAPAAGIRKTLQVQDDANGAEFRLIGQGTEFRIDCVTNIAQFASSNGDEMRFFINNGNFAGFAIQTDGQIFIGNNIHTGTAAARIHIGTGSNTEIGLIVQGRTTQTGNLTQWWDSLGNVQAWIGAGGSVVFNEEGNDADFRVEGNTISNLLLVNGGTDVVETHGGRIVNTTRVTAIYTALVTDHMIYADTDGGAFTLTLPAGVEGQEFRIANVGTAGLDLTIDGDGAETVRKALTQIVSDNEIMILIYNAIEGWI